MLFSRPFAIAHSRRKDRQEKHFLVVLYPTPALSLAFSASLREAQAFSFARSLHSLKSQRSPRGTAQHYSCSWFVPHFASQVLSSAVLCGFAERHKPFPLAKARRSQRRSCFYLYCCDSFCSPLSLVFCCSWRLPVRIRRQTGLCASARNAFHLLAPSREEARGPSLKAFLSSPLTSTVRNPYLGKLNCIVIALP